jgi:hypothetical protein
MKKSNYIIGNRTRDLPPCSAVPQPTAPPRAQVKIYRSIILNVALYGCKTWSLTLRDEHRLRVFENRDEVTGEWRKLHNEELNYMYSSPNIVRVINSRTIRWAGHVARMRERRTVYSAVLGKPEGKETTWTI